MDVHEINPVVRFKKKTFKNPNIVGFISAEIIKP